MNSIDVNKSSDNKIVDDSFQAFLTEGAFFTSKEEYPILQERMISKTIPQKIIPFDKAICYKGDLTDSFVCFFAPDRSFERVRKNPKRYVSFFRRTAGIIGFDFSIHSDMPIIKQKSQINDNISLSFFFGNQGIPIIPNIRCGDEELEEEFFETVPKKSIVAIGTHGFCKEKREKMEWYVFIDRMIKAIDPTVILVYGPINNKLFDPLKKRSVFIEYEPWITSRFKQVIQNGD